MRFQPALPVIEHVRLAARSQRQPGLHRLRTHLPPRQTFIFWPMGRKNGQPHAFAGHVFGSDTNGLAFVIELKRATGQPGGQRFEPGQQLRDGVINLRQNQVIGPLLACADRQLHPARAAAGKRDFKAGRHGPAW